MSLEITCGDQPWHVRLLEGRIPKRFRAIVGARTAKDNKEHKACQRFERLAAQYIFFSSSKIALRRADTLSLKRRALDG